MVKVLRKMRSEGGSKRAEALMEYEKKVVVWIRQGWRIYITMRLVGVYAGATPRAGIDTPQVELCTSSGVWRVEPG